jgi:ATP-dependent protease ClpP protease subunit
MVAVAGSKGYRWVAPTADYMIHYGVSDATANSHVSAERIMKASVRHFLMVLEHYNQNCHIPDLEDRLKFDDLYITADKAIGYGLADGFLNEYPN